MYLIDTSVWIDFLRGKESTQVEFLEKLLMDGEAYLCSVTYAEILWGAMDVRQFKKYEEYFTKIPFLNLPDLWHQNVSHMGYTLRKSGFKPFLPDLLIGLIAVHNGVPVLTTDRDFLPYKKIFGLQILS